MIPDMTLPLPGSLASLLAVFGPLFTAPSFRTFCGLACGFLAQTGRRTVCGMLAGAGLSRLWPHDRAHWFFSRARWSADDLGLAVARLVAGLLVPAGEPVTVAIDDTLFRRRGKKVLGSILVSRRIRSGTCENGIRQQLGDRGYRGEAAGGPPPGRHPGAGEAGHQEHELRIEAVAGPPHDRAAGQRPARPGHPCGRRFRLRRQGAEEAAAPGDLDHPAAQGRRPARAAAAAHRPARPAPAEGRPAARSGQARRHRRVHRGHRDPLRQDRRHQRRRGHLPVALGLRYQGRHRRADPRPVSGRL